MHVKCQSFGKSLYYAVTGLGQAARRERNFRAHLLAAALVLGIAWLLPLHRDEWALLVLAIVLVLAVELLNTALEALVDLLSPQENPLAALAKNTAAGAVLVVSIGAVVIGLLVLGPHLVTLLKMVVEK